MNRFYSFRKLVNIWILIIIIIIIVLKIKLNLYIIFNMTHIKNYVYIIDLWSIYK